MGVSYLDVIDRMKWAGRLKNDSAVARALDITPQALSNYKKRGEMPSNLIIEFSERFGISIDWMVTGSGDVYRRAAAAEDGAPYSGKSESIDPEEIIYIGKLLKVIRADDKSHSSAIKNAIDSVLFAMERTAVKAG
ncbi:MAG: helix-turn-helix domain-containing protein [Deltaproteobacteria bacterium]|nr:helix-turn-helix domain-containing protein [Deltaproteobacteria bacterium]